MSVAKSNTLRRLVRPSKHLRKLIRDYERMAAAGRANNRPIGGVNCCCCRHIHGRPNNALHVQPGREAGGL